MGHGRDAGRVADPRLPDLHHPDRHLGGHPDVLHPGSVGGGASGHVRQRRQVRADGGAVLHLRRRADGPRRHLQTHHQLGDVDHRRRARQPAADHRRHVHDLRRDLGVEPGDGRGGRARRRSRRSAGCSIRRSARKATTRSSRPGCWRLPAPSPSSFRRRSA